MKNIRITESERKSILRQHSSINEQAGANKTVCDIQRALGGLTIDNILGDNTYNALISVLGIPPTVGPVTPLMVT